LITAITPGSPAGKTELQVGDIIASINDQTPSESNTLQQIIGRYKPGTEITITVFRNGSPLEYKVALEAAPGR
jgi:serine protease DegS